MKQILTIAEAAVLVQRSKRAIYQWIAAGKLSHVLGERGEKLVRTADVRTVDSQIRLGRPRNDQ